MFLSEFGRPKCPRPVVRSPTAESCKLAYRRLCGNCQFFNGTLRQTGEKACLIGKGEFSAKKSADDCSDWVRKNAEVSQ